MTISASRLPVLFVGHGSPMNAIEHNAFSAVWQALGATLPRPRAILCISAHWETPTLRVTAMSRPRTIHDFRGFPPELSALTYPAPGDPTLAEAIVARLGALGAELDQDWGLDHGTWSVLRHLFPRADVPVLQLSLPLPRTPDLLLGLGRALGPLRREGIFVMGSGNLVHNLRVMRESDPYPWAVEFDEWVAHALGRGDHAALLEARKHPLARHAHPTWEHYDPLLPLLGAMDPDEEPQFFLPTLALGSISMRGFLSRDAADRPAAQ